jgi:hypothetical protein
VENQVLRLRRFTAPEAPLHDVVIVLVLDFSNPHSRQFRAHYRALRVAYISLTRRYINIHMDKLSIKLSIHDFCTLVFEK